MNETICNIMLFGGIALAVVFAVVAVILFVKLDIPKVIGDLSGSTARKQIREIREKGYESVQGSGASKKDAIKSKDSTGKIEVRDIKRKTSRSEELEKKGNERYQKAVNELKKEQKSRMDEFERETDILQGPDDYEKETDILTEPDDYERETDILSADVDYDEATDVLTPEDDADEATDVLTMEDDTEGATDVLTMEDDMEGATDVLMMEDDAEGATDILAAVDDEEATNVLTSDEEATNVLLNEAVHGTKPEIKDRAGFKIVTDIVVVHTDESI